MSDIIEELRLFLRESLMIEGITRNPTDAEIEVTTNFLSRPISMQAIETLQAVYAPKMPLRDQPGMDVRVGSHIPPRGGPGVRLSLSEFVSAVSFSNDPWKMHVRFETLHPFLDGNGRTGRTIWAWHMMRCGRDPFALPFLHRFYYQTLEHADAP